MTPKFVFIEQIDPVKWWNHTKIAIVMGGCEGSLSSINCTWHFGLTEIIYAKLHNNGNPISTSIYLFPDPLIAAYYSHCDLNIPMTLICIKPKHTHIHKQTPFLWLIQLKLDAEHLMLVICLFLKWSWCIWSMFHGFKWKSWTHIACLPALNR